MIHKFKLQINIGGSFLSRENGTLGRNLIMFPKIKAMLEEYVGSMLSIQKGIVLHKSTHSIARSVNSCKSLPLRVHQVQDIHLSTWFQWDKLVFKNLKFLFRFNFILDRLIFRTLSCITTSDSLLNNKPSYRQPLRTLSTKPERVLNSHLAVLISLFRLLLNIYWFSGGYMAIGIFINLVVSISKELWLPVYLIDTVVNFI